LCNFWLLAASPLAAQEFTLDWFTVAAGGGESGGGDFQLRATVGQSDAGNLAGGTFEMAGGFWSITRALEAPGAPTLNITLDQSSVMISWPASGGAGFALEETATLPASGSWNAINTAPQVHNGINSLRLPLATGNRYYRLRKP
jgi:hypothetical protein